jgi:dihydroneopterin aldolase
MTRIAMEARDRTAMPGKDPKDRPSPPAPAVDAAPEINATAQRILLSDLTLPCRIGVTEEERAQRQRLRFNIELEVSPRPPRRDKISEVVDYGPLLARIRKVCAEAEFRLLESLAGQIAQACFFDARVVRARIRIEKLDRYPDMVGIGCEFEYCRAET